MTRVRWAIALTLVSGCAWEPDSATCSASAQCPPGSVCQDGQCAEQSAPADASAGVGPDSGISPARDASASPPDASPSPDAATPDSGSDPGPDAGRDAGSIAGPDAGLDAGSGAPADAGPSCAPTECASTPCSGVTCSLHGTCSDATGVAVCACDDGYSPSGIACIAGASCTGNSGGNPRARFSAAPTYGGAPLRVQFDASGSSDNAGAITAYDWLFDELGATATGLTAEHTYQAYGRRCPSLTITGPSGTAWARVSVSVDRPRPRYQVRAAPGPVQVDGDLGEYVDAERLWLKSRGGALADIRMLWDADNLYVAYGVLDTQLTAVVLPGLAGPMYLDDGPELFLSKPPWTTNDLHHMINIRGAASLNPPAPAAQFVSVLQGTLEPGDQDTGYTFEMAIPWASLQLTGVSAGLELGADIALNDRNSEAVNGLQDDWIGLDAFDQPDIWGRLVLVE